MKTKQLVTPENSPDVVIVDPDIIILDCDDDKELPQKTKRKKCRHKRKVSLNNNNNKEKIIVTQNVEMRRRKGDRLRKSTTDYYREKIGYRRRDEPRSSNRPSHRNIRVVLKDRIVPICFRGHHRRHGDVKCCWPTEKKVYESTKQKSLDTYHERNQRQRRRCKRGRGKLISKRDVKTNQNMKKTNLNCNESILSPISSSPFSDKQDLTYEDISTVLSSFTESDEELDILIKRTKERERIMFEKQFDDEIPLNTSTPCRDENILTPSSDNNASLHSLATLVIEPLTGWSMGSMESLQDYSHVRSEVYSPTMSIENLLENDPSSPVAISNAKFIKTEEKSSTMSPNLFENNQLESIHEEKGFIQICETKYLDNAIKIKSESLQIKEEFL